MNPVPPPIPHSPWRLVLWLVGLGVVIILSIPLVIYFYGQHQWSVVQAELRMKDEKLTAQEIKRPSVPDAENFFADPLWKELPTKSGSGIKSGSMGWNRLNPPVLKEEKERLQAKYPGIAWPEKSEVRTSVVLTAWNKKPENASPEEVTRTAWYVQEAMGPALPFLDKMRALDSRPRASFPLRLEDGMAISLPHISYLITAAQLLNVQARMDIALGNGEEAFQDALLILSLSQRIKDEPTLISFLVRITLMNLAMEVVATGTKAHALTDGQLREFDRLFSSLNFVPEFQAALRGERIFFNTTVESLKKGDLAGNLASMAGVGKGMDSPAGKLGLSLWYGAVGKIDQASYNALLQEWIEELQQAPILGLPAEPIVERRLKDLMENPVSSSSHLLTVLALPSLVGCEAKMAQIQDRVLMARVACALERYWIKEGKYPESLETLVPEYLAEPLRSAVDLQPFHYALEPTGSYLLYSIGIDHKDDGGSPAYKSEPGDWVWGKYGKASSK